MALCSQCLGGSFIQATTRILTISTFLPKPWQNDNLFQLVVQQRGGQNLRWTRFYPEKCFEIFAHFSFEIIFQVRVAPGEECCRRHRQTPSLWRRGRWRWSASWLRWAPPATKPPQKLFWAAEHRAKFLRRIFHHQILLFLFGWEKIKDDDDEDNDDDDDDDAISSPTQCSAGNEEGGTEPATILHFIQQPSTSK